MPENNLSAKIKAAANRNIKERDYWLNKLSGVLTGSSVCGFPYDFKKVQNQGEGKIKTGRVPFRLPREIEAKLRERSKGVDHILHIYLTSVLVLLLNKYTGSSDILVGTPIYKQDTKGEFINRAVVLRIRLEERITVKELLLQMKQTILEAIENQNYPIEMLPGKLNLPFSGNGFPLFETAILLESIHDKEYLNGIHQGTTFSFSGKNGSIEGMVEYDSRSYTELTIERICGHFARLLKEALYNLDTKVYDLDMLSAPERKQVLFDFNDTGSEYPRKKTIHRLFAEQSAKTPDNIAVVGPGAAGGITYRELNRQSGGLAYQLKERGVRPDTIVGIRVERSVEMITGILGILKSGGAYLPIDPDYPEERVKYMLEDSGAKILLTLADLSRSSFPSCVKDFLPHISPVPAASLAYIIYTSGTTGKPKGTLTTHFNVVRVVKNTNYIRLTGDDRVLQLSNYAFDGSVFDIYGALLNGSALVMIKGKTVSAVDRLADVILREAITVFFLTTALFNALVDIRLDCLKNIRKILFGGERVSTEHTGKALAHLGKHRIIHVYGPTETTVYAAYYFIRFIHDAAITIPIGKPISNTAIYILDKWLRPVPIGVNGEVYIGGDGVARGYLNRPELTHERFSVSSVAKKIYKTGDLARWLPDGNIEFSGRIDSQIKMRGFRIELGEIESRLRSHPRVREAVVISKESEKGGRGRYICAYIVGKSVENTELKQYLSRTLPHYMIPSIFIHLDEIPLTPNGKIDKTSLPEPQPGAGDINAYVPPRCKEEEKLVEIWADVLGIDKGVIGIDSNFFRLGGHSLTTTVLISKIHREFNVKIPHAQVFKTPSPRGLYDYIYLNKKGSLLYSSIRPAEKREYYPQSSAQRRLFFLEQLEDIGVTYNMPLIVRMEGKIHEERIEEVFETLSARHESLRTSFHLVDGEPVQRIQEAAGIAVEHFQAEAAPSAASIIKGFIRPFDLSHAPLLRVGLIISQENKHILLIDIHHILGDGVSMGILIGEFVRLYSGEKLLPLKTQYKDFSTWQNNLFETGKIKDREAYWLQEFEGEVPVLDMPVDRPRPAIQSFEGNIRSFNITGEETGNLYELAREEGATLFVVLLSLFNVFLSKTGNREDIVVGSPIAGRSHADLGQIIGMFVNTLALRNRPCGEKTFADFLKEVKERTLAAFENQDYQFEYLVEKVAPVRDTGRHPLFNVVLVLQNTPGPPGKITAGKIPGLTLTLDSFEKRTSKFDLTLTAIEEKENVYFSFEYCTKLFKEETIVRFIDYFKKVLWSAVEDPGKRISEIEVIGGDEKKRLLYDFNDTQAGYPRDKVIHGLFAEQAVKTPDNIAVVGPAGAITYRELNKRSNRLAAVLKGRGVLADTIVGIMVERSVEMIAGLLGILKAGGAYLPVDPAYPEERKNFMLTDSGAKILLSFEEIKMSVGNRLACSADTVSSTLTSTCRISPANAAYIIYTSGTTGKPKGVMIEHGNVVRLMVNDKFLFDFNHRDIWTMFHSFCFDFSVWEIYGALLYGGQLVIISAMAARDTHKYLQILKEKQVTILNQTPSAFYHLMNLELQISRRELALRYVIFGGEALSPGRLKAWRAAYPGTKLVNMYGITETTVHVTFKEIGDEDIESGTGNIGKPLPTLSIYIVDKHLKLLPVGAAGELTVGGKGVGRGYLNRPEMTVKKFAGNPYKPGERFYRSGDLAKWSAEGELQYLGRIDQQVKIRGFRIEPGEIERRLSSHPQIKDAVVTAAENQGGDKYLCAYIVSHSNNEVPGLRDYLLRYLPEYMVPAYFIPIAGIPLTSNGKLDLKALPVPGPGAAEMYAAPRDRIEEKLVRVWSEVLGRHGAVGIDDNFFEIGGHSLKATVLISGIHKELQVKIPLADIFKFPTIREMAKCIKDLKETEHTSIEPVEKQAFYALSSAQKRFYFLHRQDKKGTRCNMPLMVRWEGIIDKERLAEAFRQLIKRHESLRTSFHMVDDEAIQKIHDAVEFEIEYIRMEHRDFIRPFDISEAPLMRVGLITEETNEYILLVDIHHIVSDGVSMGIMVRDFAALYSGEQLPPLRVRYKDFSLWQNKLFASGAVKQQEAYWLKEFAGPLPVLDMPLDYERPKVRDFEGSTAVFETDAADTGALKALARENGATLYMVLLAVFNILLWKVSGQEDIVVGCPAAGRRHADLESVIGIFVNTLALRNKPRAEQSFNRFLEQVKQKTLAAFDAQDYPFEELVEKIGLNRDLSRNPVFDVLFLMQNTDILEAKIPGVNLKPLNYETMTAKFDLNVMVYEGEDKLFFNMQYDTKLFNGETIEKFIFYFKKILSAVIENPGMTLSGIKESLELNDVREELLTRFNENLESECGYE